MYIYIYIHIYDYMCIYIYIYIYICVLSLFPSVVPPDRGRTPRFSLRLEKTKRGIANGGIANLFGS